MTKRRENDNTIYFSNGLKIFNERGTLVSIFNLNRVYDIMKYGKLVSETLHTKEVENGREVGGTLSEDEIISEGYKPVCEISKPVDADFYVYVDYGSCFVQVWKKNGDEILENEIWTSDSGMSPKYTDIQRLKRDISAVEDSINTLSLSNNEALSVMKFYPEWTAESISVKKGERYRYNNLLWEVIKDHITQESWKPSIETSSLWKVVNEEHEGSIEDPIPYNPPMEIFNEKYYIQSEILYKCIRNSEIPLSHNLSDLIGTYVTKVD